MAGNDKWNLNRVGRAANATSVYGQPPAYGLALDLGTRTAPAMTTEQYQTMMRELGMRKNRQALDQTAQYQTELASARNFQSGGVFTPEPEFHDDGGPTWLGDLLGFESNLSAEDAMDAYTLGMAGAKDIYSNIVGGGVRDVMVDRFGGDVDLSYERYKDLGGFLSRDDFDSFDLTTQGYLIHRAEADAQTKQALGLPGIKQGVDAFITAYRGAQVPFILSARAGLNPIDRIWFDSGQWKSAWDKSENQSLGNAIVDSVMQPWYGEERVDRWKRDNAIYQLTSLGTELGAAWYLDPGVLGGQAIGASTRLARGEAPLNKRAYVATQQALQREQITVGGIAGAYGKLSAKRMNSRKPALREYAKTHSFGEFANLRMFRHRDVDGGPAAAALYWAYTKAPESDINLSEFVSSKDGEGVALNYPDIPTLTEQLVHGDAKAYADLDKLNHAAPEELNKFAPGAQTYLDAIEATKTKLPQLQKEMEDLQRIADEENGGQMPLFYEWSVHADVARKQADIDEVDEILNKYEDYGDWLSRLDHETSGNTPRVSQIGPKRALFFENQFGKAHSVLRYTRGAWIKRANTAEMHDVDTGVMSIRRQFEQFDHLFGYQNTEALDDYLMRWIDGDPRTRAETMRELEEVHLINAAAQYFDVDPEVIRTVYKHAVDKQNRVRAGIRRGHDSIFSTAPTAAQRAEDPESNLSILSYNDETKMVDIELMDNGTKVSTRVHRSALEDKPTGPIDPTQTVNYYDPIDTRQFYLELKRNQDVVQEMSKARFYGAVGMEGMDWALRGFNKLWKPAVLFRFGWPQRVLMDENMRALAVLGIPAFTRHYGEAYSRAMNNAAVRTTQAVHNRINSLIVSPYLHHKTGRRELNIGPGPVADKQRRLEDPVIHDQIRRDTPHVPESFTPVMNNARYERIAKAIGEWDDYERSVYKAKALEREGNEPLVPAEGLAQSPVTPLRMILNRRGDDTTFNPVSGRPERGGFVVPLEHTRARIADNDHDLMEWYRENREILGSTGFRVHLDGDDIVVVRHFTNRTTERHKAATFAQFTDAPMVNLKTGVSARFDQAGSGFRDEATEMNDEFDKAHRALGELRAQEARALDADPDMDFDFDLNFLQNALEKVWRRRPLGERTRTARSKDGQKFEYPDAFATHQGEVMRALISSQGAVQMLSDGFGGATNLFRRQAAGQRAYNPPNMTTEARTRGTRENKKALQYFNEWSRLLNTQVANSPIWNKMLNGWSDEKITGWLRSTPEGAEIRRQFKDQHPDTAFWVNEHRAKLDYYLPNKKLQRLLGKGKLDTAQLRREVFEEDYPTVFGPDIEEFGVGGVAKNFPKFLADKVWYTLGTLPIDTLSRHPFARSMYDLRMKSLIAQHNGDWIDDKTLRRFETESRKFTRDQVRKTLYDLTDQTNLTDMLRFVAPFWGAQTEAIVKWAKIVSDRPETVARAFALNNAVYQNLVVIDEEGKPKSRLAIEEWERKTGEKWDGSARGRFSWHPTDRVILRVPQSLRHGPFGKALETIGSAGIPIGSANTVLQGEMPLLPGPGPLVTIPADKLLRTLNEETLGTEFSEETWYQWLFPIGRPRSGGWKGMAEQVLPGWGKRVMQFSEADQGIAYTNLMVETGREMELEARRKGEPLPTPAEIKAQADWVWRLRIFTSLVAPVQMQYRPKHQFFIDEARRYQKDFGINWFDKFVDEYGTAMARYTSSATVAPVGTPPTIEGITQREKHKGLIAKYGEHWGDAIVGPEAYDAEFNGDVYYAQTQINVGPGDDTRLRESQDFQTRQATTDARVGWYEYRKVQAILDVELEQLGATSLQQTSIPGVQELADMKANFVADLTRRNPAWRADYDSFENDIYTKINQLEQWVNRDEFDKRPDIQGVRHYLMIRNDVAAALDRYAATTGGSRSLASEENTELREWFYGQVGAIAQQNPAFAEFYGRYLSQDTLEQGSGGY